MTALGIGAAIGVVTLLWLQRRLPRQFVFTTAVVATGVSIIAVASMSSLFPAFLLVAALGAGAGLRVRDRIHAVAGERLRRHAGPHVRDALHDRPPLPVAVTHDLAVHRGRSQRDLTPRLQLGDPRRAVAPCPARRPARVVAGRCRHRVLGPRRAAAHEPPGTTTDDSPSVDLTDTINLAEAVDLAEPLEQPQTFDASEPS